MTSAYFEKNSGGRFDSLQGLERNLGEGIPKAFDLRYAPCECGKPPQDQPAA